MNGKLPDLRLLIAALWMVAVVAIRPAAIAQETDFHMVCWGPVRGRIRSSSCHATSADGGALRLADELSTLRRRFPGLIALSAGDFYAGSPETAGPGFQVGRRIRETLSPDVTLMGRHDMEDGPDGWNRRYRDGPGVALAANVKQRTRSAPVAVQAYRAHTNSGICMVIIGLASPETFLLPSGSDPSPFYIEHEVDALERIWPDVQRHKPDVVVVFRQSSCRRDLYGAEALLKWFPDVDLIIGVNPREPMTVERIGSSRCVDIDGYARRVLHIQGVFDGKTRDVRAWHFDWIDLDGPYDRETEWARTVEPYLAAVDKGLDEPLGMMPKAKGEGTAERWREWPAFAAEAALKMCGADAACLSTAGSGRPAGACTLRDLWRVAPYNNRIVTVTLPMPLFKTLWGERRTMQEGTVYGLSAPGGDVRCLPDPRFKRHARSRVTLLMDTYTAFSNDGRYVDIKQLAHHPEARLTVTTNRLHDIIAGYIRKAPYGGDE